MHYLSTIRVISVLISAITMNKTNLGVACTSLLFHFSQSDNGCEFRNALLEDLRLMWPQLMLVHGRPRHSQSQVGVCFRIVVVLLHYISVCL